jgi:hypothetical protein
LKSAPNDSFYKKPLPFSFVSLSEDDLKNVVTRAIGAMHLIYPDIAVILKAWHKKGEPEEILNWLFPLLDREINRFSQPDELIALERERIF